MANRFVADRPEDLEGPRACLPLELPGVLDLTNFVLRTLGTAAGQPPRAPSIGFDYPHVFHQGNLDNIRVFVHRGRIVCSVGIYPNIIRTPQGEISVGGICGLVTHPDYRNLGLGTEIMEDAQKKMLTNGHHIGLLSTGIQDYYRKLGWESGGGQRIFSFDRGNIGILPESNGLEISENWQPLHKALNDLHLRELLTSLRSSERFHLLMERKANRIFVALLNSVPVAYAAVRGTTIVEYAGGEEVRALCRFVFNLLDNPSTATSQRSPGQRATVEMRIQTPDSPNGLPGFFIEKRIPHSFGYLGMIKMIDAVTLFQALGISRVKIERSERGYHLTFGETECNLSERELVQLVFGPERIIAFASEIFPISLYQWSADRV